MENNAENICKTTPEKDRFQIISLRAECKRLREENDKMRINQPPSDAVGFRATYAKEFNFKGDDKIWCCITVKPVDCTIYRGRKYHYYARICVPCDPCRDVEYYREKCYDCNINYDTIRQDGEYINIYRDWQHDMDYHDLPISYIEAWINTNAARIAAMRNNGDWL